MRSDSNECLLVKWFIGLVVKCWVLSKDLRRRRPSWRRDVARMWGQCWLVLETEQQDSFLVLEDRKRTLSCASRSTPLTRTSRVGATRSSYQSVMATTALILLVLMAANAGAEAKVEESIANSIVTQELTLGRQIQQLLQQGASGVASAAQGRIGHRLRLLFPLVIAIATRLGTLVPIGLSVLGAVTLMVVFAKKAFIVSLLTLGLVLWDKWARTRPHAPPPTYHPSPTFIHHPPDPAPTVTSWSPPSHHGHWPPAPPPTHAGPHWVESGHPVLHSPAHAIFQGHAASPSAVHHSYTLTTGSGEDDGFADASTQVQAQRRPPPSAYYAFPPHRMAQGGHHLAGARRRGNGRGGDAPSLSTRWSPATQS